MHYPSKPLLRRQMQQQGEDSLDEVVQHIFDRLWVDLQCQVSNDPPEEGQEIPDLKLCNIVEYKCPIETNTGDESDVQVEAKETAVVVPYQYELHYNPEADFERLKTYLEEASLEHLAAAAGLLNCKHTGGASRRLDGDQAMFFTPEQQSRLIGVAKTPPDDIDRRFESCLVEDNEDLTGKVSLAAVANSECVSMIGGLTLYLAPDTPEAATKDTSMMMMADKVDAATQTAALHQAVRNVLKAGMENDLYIAPGNIEKVTFVEYREPAVSSTTEKTTDRTTGDDGVLGSSTSRGLLYAGIGLVALIVVAALLATKRRRGRDKSLDPEAMVADAEESLDGSLAEKDSLALKPQALQDVPPMHDDPEEQAESPAAHAAATANPTESLVVVRTATHPYDSDHEGEGTVGQASTYDSVYLENNKGSDHEDTTAVHVPAGKYSDLENSVLAEVESSSQEIEEEYERQIRPRQPSATHDRLGSLSMSSDDYETSSENTPRRTLQMT